VEADLGGPVAPQHLDLAEAPGLEPQRLGDRLLGAEARGQVLTGTAPRSRVLALGVGEQSRGEPGPALQRLLETLDLEQVDPDPGRAGGQRELRCHSTVTVLARLRGWSTLQPRSVAMK
jgi:hypothetical protein